MKNPRITEQEIGIIKDAQAGNMLAFNKLFKRYKSFVTNVLFQYIKDMMSRKTSPILYFLKFMINSRNSQIMTPLGVG